MEKKILIKSLYGLLKINPDISAEGLIKLAEYYVDMIENTENVIKNQGDTVRIHRVADIVVKEYKSENKKAQEEYKQKFLDDIEKLKAQKAQKQKG